MAADVDLDGKVSVEEFDSMIEAAAALPRYIFPEKPKSRCVLKLYTVRKIIFDRSGNFFF